MISRSRRNDDGLTLVELVVTITILGIVTTALTGAMTVFIRSQNDPSNRVDRTRGLQQLVNYFPADVASSQRFELEPPWTQPCLSLGTPIPILNLVWSESFPGSETETVSVTYIVTSDGSKLVRNKCGSASAGTVTVARDITDANAQPGIVVPGQIDLVLEFDAQQTVISGSSRNR